MEKSLEHGFKPLYADTDGFYVVFDEKRNEKLFNPYHSNLFNQTANEPTNSMIPQTLNNILIKT